MQLLFMSLKWAADTPDEDGRQFHAKLGKEGTRNRSLDKRAKIRRHCGLLKNFQKNRSEFKIERNRMNDYLVYWWPMKMRLHRLKRHRSISNNFAHGTSTD